MELGLAPGSSAQPAPPPAKYPKLAATANDKKKDQLLLLVSKLSLSSALQTRVLKAATLHCYLLPRNHQVVQKGYAATKQYHEQVKTIQADKRMETMGQPHVHLFNAILMVGLEKTADQAKKDLQTFVDEVQKQPDPPARLKFLSTQIKVVRLCKCAKKDTIRLEIHIPAGDMATLWWKVLHPWLLHEGARYLEGPAPPGDLERQIQTILNDLEGRTGDYMPEHMQPMA